MTGVEPTENPPKPVSLPALVQALEGFGLPIDLTTSRVIIDFGRSQIEVLKVAVDEHNVVQFVRGAGGWYDAMYIVQMPIDREA